LSDGVAEALKTHLQSHLDQARNGQLPINNPIMQVMEFVPASRVDHQKTDTFLHRLQYASESVTKEQLALAMKRVFMKIRRTTAADQVAVERLPATIEDINKI
jgi:hypothetical protein